MVDPVLPWLSIVGMADAGMTELSGSARAALDQADIIFGAERHLELADAGSRGRAWPVPFSIEPLLAMRGQRVAALVSGDPFWFGAGSVITRYLEHGEWHAFPAASTFSLAAARLGWPLEETLAIGLHAAPFARLRPLLSQGVRAIVLIRDGEAAGQLAGWLVEHGFGASQLHVLEALGGRRERIRHRLATDWDLRDVVHPVALAIDCRGRGLPRSCGLPDDLFDHDGQITKQAVRAVTLSALAPRPGELLWDIGAGSGSIAIEFLLAAPGARAICVEAAPDRLARLRRNAESFGVGHRIEVIAATAPDGLSALPAADAVFVGGGLSGEMLEVLWPLLPNGGRLVANAVTLESEALLIQWSQACGGSLVRLEIAHAAALGGRRGWRPAMPIVQWSVTK